MLYIQKGLEGTPEVLIDPEQLVVGLDRAADRVRSVEGCEVRGVRHVEERLGLAGATRSSSSRPGRRSSDNVEWVKVSGVAWHGDGFFYSRYPAPEKGKEKASINENHQVFFHRVGTPQSADELVFQDAANPQRFHILETTEDERFAILSVSDRGKGKDGNAIFVRDLTKGGGVHAA